MTLAIAGSMLPLLAAGPGRLGGGGSLQISLYRVVAVAVFGVILAIVAGLLLKRGGGKVDLTWLRPLAIAPAGKRIQILETRRISQHADACLFRCDGQDYLVLSSQSSQQLLNQAPATASAAP